MKAILLFLLLILAFNLYANDGDTVITKSGRKFIGIAHHQNDKTVSITILGDGEISSQTITIIRDSIVSMSIDKLQANSRQLFEKNGIYSKNDTTKVGLSSHDIIDSKNRSYYGSLSIDLLKLLYFVPSLNLELGRNKINGKSTMISFSYDYRPLYDKKIIAYEKSNKSNRKARIYSDNLLVSMGIKFYFRGSKIGAFYVNPNIGFAQNTFRTEYIYNSFFSYYSTYYDQKFYAINGEIVGGYCINPIKKLMINFQVGTKAIKFNNQEFQNFYFFFNYSIAMGLTF